ncbi:MFS transporter [Achromobacter sp. Marseille-Q0513]|uniref:MFS transporter n=1 Tax=Achromobacter sp. Marseille-Q0513 TaxID=2829161 RepID=UPI001B94ADE6|nr:MFS transporter [Achromobacter sp. Marseille-Q0513]MBR8654360.1 MFS transporter [Achromobacter sp. Marseille-Q0513]
MNASSRFATRHFVAPQDAATQLADRLPLRILLPYLLAAMSLALAYGASFLLADALVAAGHEASRAGTVIGIGIVATLVGSVFAGRWAERMGILPLIACAAGAMAMAMACFALLDAGGLPMAYAGGLLLGLGWAVFYMLAPILLIHCLKPKARLEALTLLSGSQMLGMGLAAPLGHFLARQSGRASAAFAAYAACCAIAAGVAWLLRRSLARQPQLELKTVALSLSAVACVLRAKTVLPVALMGIAACTFAGLSTFQSLYAQSRGLSADTFFLTFTITTVLLRFTVASWIGKLPLGRLALSLFAITLCGILLLAVNAGSAPLYVAATILFATGYGLTYSTLNAMAVNLADGLGISIPAASQVFTLGYFAGAFGFPYVAGSLIAASGIDAALWMMLGLVGCNLAVAAVTPAFRTYRLTRGRP